MIEPRAPLADRLADLARLGARELAFLAQVDLRCEPEDAARLGLPLEPNTAGAFAGAEALWLGPDEWLVVGPEGWTPRIVSDLETALAGRRRSVLDVSANRTTIELAAPDRLEHAAVLPEAWLPDLRALGVAAVFGPGTPLADTVAFVREAVAARRARRASGLA